jgi:SAM-dependent methyltransferase
MTAVPTRPLDNDKLDAFIGRFIADLGTALHVPAVLIGDRLGLYRAIADGEPVTPAELADRTGTAERYVAEWLAGQAAAGYIDFDPAAGTFRLPAEHAFALVDQAGPVFIPAAFQLAASTVKDEPLITEAFRTGEGVAWHAHHPDLFTATERFFRPGYAAHLTSEWIPALDGMEEKLRAGATVADIGCGHGASTLIMAQTYPSSTFAGFDYHQPSIDTARVRAETAGVADRVSFDVATAKEFPGDGYDLVTVFDCLHDMGDPVGAARHVRSSLAADGTWMIVEPFASDRLEDNLTPMGKIGYNVSTLVCTPASKAQEVGLALGAQAGERRMRDVVTDAGFRRFRRVAETPINLIYEARP